MSLLKDSLQAFHFIQRQQGWLAAFKMTLQFIRTPFFAFYRGYVLSKHLSGPIQLPKLKHDLSFKEITVENASLLGSINPQIRVKRMIKKLQAGEVCNVAILGKRVIGYVFAGFENTPSTLDARLKLRPKEAYLWAGYTLPEFRRQGVVGAVNLDLCRQLEKRGYENVVILVERHNTASLGHLDKIGYHIIEIIKHLRIFRWGISQFTPIEASEIYQSV